MLPISGLPTHKHNILYCSTFLQWTQPERSPSLPLSQVPTCFIHVLDPRLRGPAVLINDTKQLPVAHHLSLALTVVVELDPATITITL